MTQASKPYLILVGIDYSTPSELALQRALELTAEHPDAELHVVHVVPSFDTPPSQDAGSDQNMDMLSIDPQAYQKLQMHVGMTLGAFEKKRNGAADRPLRVISHLRLHTPAHEIAQLAADLEADLVVVASPGAAMLRDISSVRSLRVSLASHLALSSCSAPRASRRNIRRSNRRAHAVSRRELHPEEKNTGANNTVSGTVSGTRITR